MKKMAYEKMAYQNISGSFFRVLKIVKALAG